MQKMLELRRIEILELIEYYLLLTADTKGAVRFQLEGNATSFRMTKNNDNTYTMKAGNRVYGRNMSAERAREVIRETQERFERLNKGFRRK